MEFLCERGRVLTRNHHAWFELWGRGEEELDGDFQRQFPFPWHSRRMVDAIERLAQSKQASKRRGEFGREALEIGTRESYRPQRSPHGLAAARPQPPPGRCIAGIMLLDIDGSGATIEKLKEYT